MSEIQYGHTLYAFELLVYLFVYANVLRTDTSDELLSKVY
jgi:hypothetical protein